MAGSLRSIIAIQRDHVDRVGTQLRRYENSLESVWNIAIFLPRYSPRRSPLRRYPNYI